jgi:large subunit ribosomal protein L30
MQNVVVTLVRSLIGRTVTQKMCATGLGLSKIGQTVSLPRTKEVLGMIKKIHFMLKVED